MRKTKDFLVWGFYYWIPESIGIGFLYLLATFVGGLISGFMFLGFKVWWGFGGKGCKVRSLGKTCETDKRKKRKNCENGFDPYNYKPIRF